MLTRKRHFGVVILFAVGTFTLMACATIKVAWEAQLQKDQVMGRGVFLGTAKQWESIGTLRTRHRVPRVQRIK